MAERGRGGEERRAQIAAAATRLLGRRGIASLTMASLAAEVGVTPGALFRHFPSREAILAAAAGRLEARLTEALAVEDLSPLERLESFARAATASPGGEPPLARVLLSDQILLALPEDSAARLGAAIERARAFVVRALRDAAVRGELRADLPAEDLAPIFLGAVHALSLGASGVGPRLLRARPEGVRRALFALLARRLPSGRGEAEGGPGGSRARASRRTSA